MNPIELAIIEQIAQLDEAAQQQVLELARQLVTEQINRPSDLGAWLEQASRLREELRAKYGPNHFNSQELLDELREEASVWPRKS